MTKAKNEKFISLGMRKWMHSLVKEIAEENDISIADVFRMAIEVAYPDRAKARKTAWLKSRADGIDESDDEYVDFDEDYEGDDE